MDENRKAAGQTHARRGRWGLLIVILLEIIISAIGLAIVIYEITYTGRIYPGVNVLGLDVGGLTPREAEAFLQENLGYYQEERLLLRYGDRTWDMSAHELGADLDAERTVAAAYHVGGEGNILDNLYQQAKVLRFGHTVLPALSFDEGRCALRLSQLAQEINHPVRNADLIVEGLEVQEIKSQTGLQLDIEATRELIRQRIASPSRGDIDLVIREIPPALPDVSEAKIQVEHMIAAPITLTFTDRTWVYTEALSLRTTERTWTLDRATIADMIVLRRRGREDGRMELVPSLAEGKLRAFVERIALQIDQPARDARFDFDPEKGTLTPIVPSQEGRTLDVEETVRLISGQVASGARMIPLPVIIERPKVPMEEVDRLGIVELVSQGVTSFKGSSRERAQNIKAGAKHLHGVVVPPGEVFSFNESLGDVSEDEGYLESLVIYPEGTAWGLGGGLCQVATTCFRAAFWGGYPIVERVEHAYRVSWYEPLVGLDAAVYRPTTDFKFQNDTPYCILIQTKADIEKGVLTFNFYSTKTGRTVDMEGPYEENRIPHGPPIYEEDPTLPKGTKKQIDWPHDGVDVTIYRVIKQDGQVLKRERFFSHYKPWPAKYLVGTGE